MKDIVGAPVFIDANILLSFYDFTDDNLDQLEELGKRAKGGNVKLLLPENTVDEYWRNRDKKIFDCLKKLRDNKSSEGLPRIAQGYPEHDAILKIAKELARARSTLIESIESDAREGKLKADRVIEELIDAADVLCCTEDHRIRARQRRDYHKPPGKPDSLGDQTAWEILLDAAPKGSLVVVTRDRDWSSPLNPAQAHSQLHAEWSADKEGELRLFSSLRDYLQNVDLGIQLAEDEERSAAVQALYNSGSFASTHRAIEKLAQFVDFTTDEIDLIFSAIMLNPQVEWIGTDSDVQNFYANVIENYGDVTSEGLLDHAKKAIEYDEYQKLKEFDLDDIF